MTVVLNPIRRTNLLKSVKRPLGATFDMDYERVGNTYDMPNSRFVLSRLSVFDGHIGEGADTQLTTYKYENGFQNRFERDFYGFRRVTQEQRNTAANDVLYRSTVQEFLNDSFYRKGLLKRETLSDGQGRPFTETENSYQLRDVATGLAPADAGSAAATLFPEMVRTDKRFYEGQLSPGKTTFTTNEYDALGNIRHFTDDGELGVAADNVDATIAYSICSTYVNKANSITVLGNGAEMRRRNANIDCTTGNVTQVQQFVGNGQIALTELTYFPNGNLQSVIGPANQLNQRYTFSYEYDPEVATHVARVSDSFGLSSQATYNFLFGKVLTTTDTNNNQTTNAYDTVGRLQTIFGPYEQSQTVATLSFEFHPEADIPYAITRHVDKDADGGYKNSGTIDTILFTDGLKRVIQTKKDASVLENASAPQDRMIVSGQVSFDAFGRTIAQRYPLTEPKSSEVVNGRFNPGIDTSVPPTLMDYDVLDRNTKTTIPDATFTTIAYGFGPDRSGAIQFETVVTDANVNAGLKGAVKRSYRDVRELITSVKEFNKSGAEVIWTSYAYDPLKQIVQVLDDKLNTTKVSYDNLGRRTVIDNPDTGRTETQYDTASNVTKKITANVRAQTKSIDYTYDFNRLSSITYPNFAGNNVTYAYGAPGAGFNTAGRITRITSQMGTEERQYGKLGETVYEKKTVTTFTDPLHPSVYETKFNFETFGRLLRITYPDGEIVTNSYDSGGNLTHAEGVKAGSANGQKYTYRYLQNLYYDKFEQRAFVEQGNGVKTAYTYNAQNRRLAALTAGSQGLGNTLFQNLSYNYDKVGNVLELKNDVALPHANDYGGPSVQRFEYDDLYRLTKGQGVFPANVAAANADSSACNGVPSSQCRVYSMDLTYDTIHNIQRKTQVDTRYPPGGSAIGQKKTSYDFPYAYNASGTASIRPHAPNHIDVRTYTYDANGNQVGWTHDTNGTRRNIVWDDENRIQSVFDNGHEKTYKYDDQGQRAIKRGPQGETVYVNQFFTDRPGANGTKHIYAGTSRIASKLMRQDTPGANPNGKTPFEKDLYFYHPDHLGSSNYVTDLNGKLYEHLEYFPFGEGWIEENTNQQRTPYLFSAKELDEETGLYYFGARYYDPRTSLWQSSDPIDRFNPQSPTIGLNLYQYGLLNPLRYTDPHGLEEVDKVFGFIPKDAPIVTLGTAFGGLAAYVVGKASGDERLADTAVQGMAENEQSNKQAAIILMSLGRGGPKAAPQSAPKMTPRAARREAMREEGIPTSQQPKSQSKNDSGREYQYEVPKAGGGTETKSVQQQTMDRSHPGQSHWEAGKVKTDPLTGETRLNQHGRPQLQNDKSKVNY
jgi:RHS repeat-associated protein